MNKSIITKSNILDKQYKNFMLKLKEKNNDEVEDRWEIYNVIIDELIKEGDENCLNEIKYRITDGEDPNVIILDVIEKNKDNVNSLIWFLKRRVEEFLDEDLFKKFFQ